MKGDEITISSERSVRHDFLEMAKFLLGCDLFWANVAYTQVTFEMFLSDIILFFINNSV